VVFKNGVKVSRLRGTGSVMGQRGKIKFERHFIQKKAKTEAM